MELFPEVESSALLQTDKGKGGDLFSERLFEFDAKPPGRDRFHV